MVMRVEKLGRNTGDLMKALRRSLFLLAVYLASTLVIATPAAAQVSVPAVDLQCLSPNPSGAVDVPVYPGAKRKLEYTEKNPISNQVFKEIQNEEDLSNKTVRRIQSVVRKSLGPGSVESHLREELIDDPKVKAELIVEFSGNF